MCSSRYGVELAYGLLTTCFFNHNEKLVAKVENQCERPIAEYNTELNSHASGSAETFGLAFLQPSTQVTAGNAGSKQGSLNVNELTYSVFIKRIVGTEIEPVERFKSNLIEDDNDETEIPSPEVEPWEKDIHQEVLPTLSLTSARQILLRAISWHLTHRTITACSKT